MMTIDEIQEKWNCIPIYSYSDGFLLIQGEHPLSFHIGYREGCMCFIVLNTGEITGALSSKAILVENVCLNGYISLRFTLKDDSLNEIFVKVCWDLIDSSRDKVGPIASLLERYKKWLRLLQQINKEPLSASRQKGLIAELMYLKESIEKKGAECALYAWGGPDGEDQDFNFYDYWAEVKATTISSTEVQISSLQQLDRNDQGYLIIYFMDKINTPSPKALTLSKMYCDIKSSLSQYHTQYLIDLFECKIAKCGFREKDMEKYEKTIFRVNKCQKYSVDISFPRLTLQSIPHEVVAAKYVVNLPSIEEHKILEELYDGCI